MDNELRKNLKVIEKELDQIKKGPSPKRAFLYGFIQACGWFVGTVVMIALAGWLLAIAGLIPGFGKIMNYLVEFSRWHATY